MTPLSPLAAPLARLARGAPLLRSILASVESLASILDGGSETRTMDKNQSPSCGLRAVAVRPLCFRHGWLPDGFTANRNQYRGRLPGLDAELILCAAFVARPIHVSGWDMAARAPKATLRMGAPDGVYFFERADGNLFGEVDARSLWLRALGARTEEGFERAVPGVWRR
jgi:hypothetical protein